MGDIADMMLDGTLCQGCGCFISANSQGFPGYCGSCGREAKAGRKQANVARSAAQHAAAKKSPCHACGRRVSFVGMADHIKDSHGIKADGKTA